MSHNSLDYQRRCAVNKAWFRERSEVLRLRGSRNWTQAEQREIIATGKCHGYEGQHMFSVKSYPEHAGNEYNIQFLTRYEHFQAHRGNWRNKTDGRYNLRTKKVDSFKDGIPKTSYRKLSNPLSNEARDIASVYYENNKSLTNKQSSKSRKSLHDRKRLPVHKSNADSVVSNKARSKDIFCNKVSKSLSNGHGRLNAAQKGTGISKTRGNGMRI